MGVRGMRGGVKRHEGWGKRHEGWGQGVIALTILSAPMQMSTAASKLPTSKA